MTTLTLSNVRRLWRAMWHAKADRLRDGWAQYVIQWEADTEPGYPLSPLTAKRRELGLAFADLYDALGGRRWTVR